MNRHSGLISMVVSAAILLLVAGVAPAKPKGPQPLPWNALAQLNSDTGAKTADLDKLLAAKENLVSGYAIPVEISDFDHIKNFLLVPNQIGCCAGPPPPPNQIIEVTLDQPVGFEKLMGIVWLKGKLGVAKGGTGEFGYTLQKAAVAEANYDI